MSDHFSAILDRSQLTPRFQPIVTLRDHRLIGYEATIRGPAGSPFASPEPLFAEAARRGRLVECDRLCRQAAIQEFAQRQLCGRLFLNVTATTLLQPDFSPGQTLQYLDRCGLPPEAIVIEVTEQHPITDFTLLARAVSHYRNYGFAVAIDDLGAGYAGLRLWETLRPEFVKIDRHFICGLDQDPVRRRFVRSMQEIAESLECRIIAEGIETAGERAAAVALGLELGQGYFFARPRIDPPRRIPLPPTGFEAGRSPAWEPVGAAAR